MNDLALMDGGASSAVSAGEMANAIRALTMDAVQQANSGHPGMPMGMADVATVLVTQFLCIDPARPDWPDRDRLILSAGHGSMLLYALNYLLGYDDMPLEQLQRFRQLGSKTPGHPEYGHTLGVETTTGPLGQGLATAVGMAMAERMLEARYGSRVVDHYTYVLAGDGCLMEGISQEAIDLAGHLRLKRLIVLWDDNGISIDGSTRLSTSTDQLARFRAAGWDVAEADGYQHSSIANAIERARNASRPTLVACRTLIGKGAPTLEGSEKVHGAPLGKDEIAAAKLRLSLPSTAFRVPDAVLRAWRRVGERGRLARIRWEDRLAAHPMRDMFVKQLSGGVTTELSTALAAFRAEHAAARTKVATRKASEMVLGVVNDKLHFTVGGSADLTHSNLTLTRGLRPISDGDFTGRYVHYGIREHGMSAAMNGLALHGGFIPYGGTFLCFADYARGAIRLSALMRQRVVYVLTHDSIGLGEDGPTHQPVEHLAMLRATPNLNVFRPADIVETAECWELALTSTSRPSVLVLSRQALPMLREDSADATSRSERGAYVLRQPSGRRDVTLLATGSEVEIAVEAAGVLKQDHDIEAAVVSMPSWELFEAQPAAYRAEVLGSAPRIGIEAAARLGWDRWIGETGHFIGMHGFGASAPAADLYQHFGITSEAAVAAALDLVTQKQEA